MARRMLSAAVGKSILLVGLTLCVCSCSKSEVKVGSSDALTPEQKAEREKLAEALKQVEKVLADGPTEDMLKPELKADLEKKHGKPVLPMVPFRKIRPFLSEKVGSFVKQELLLPGAFAGFPILSATYTEKAEGKTREVTVAIKDNRQEDGGYEVDTMELILAKQRPHPDNLTKGPVGRFVAYSRPSRSVCIIAGRFSVSVQADISSGLNRQALQPFLDAIDLEKLSKTE